MSSSSLLAAASSCKPGKQEIARTLEALGWHCIRVPCSLHANAGASLRFRLDKAGSHRQVVVPDLTKPHPVSIWCIFGSQSSRHRMNSSSLRMVLHAQGDVVWKGHLLCRMCNEGRVHQQLVPAMHSKFMI